MSTGVAKHRPFAEEAVSLHVVLLSGGSGKRLWPLSSGARSKVFLKLLPAPGGGAESMLQRVVRQLGDAGLQPQTLVVTHESQFELTRHQLGDRLPVLTEAHRRGTFGAAALAAVHLLTAGKAERDSVMLVMPADVYAEAAFFDRLRELPAALSRLNADLVLLGTPPSRPSPEYGYIVPAEGGDSGARPIGRFVEKPDLQTAESLIAGGALWNCGVFAFTLGYMLDQLAARQLPLEAAALTKGLEPFAELSLDRELAERARSAAVVAYEGPWHDLGSWETLSERLGSTVVGEGTVSADADGTQLINRLPIPVHVIGARGLIVAASEDGILVAPKKEGSRIKAVLGEADTGPGRVEEKRWGMRMELDRLRTDGGTVSVTSRLRLFKGAATSYHSHPHARELLTVLSGSGEALIDGKRQPLSSGDILSLAPGVKHGIRAHAPLECIEIRIGPETGLLDRHRINDSW